MKEGDDLYDVIIIGSGFGGSMSAKKFVEAGLRVAMVERGDWVHRGPENWQMQSSIDLTPHYDKSLPYQVIKGGNKKEMGVYSCVGGPSVFYGGVSFRFREEDFAPPSELVADSGAEWPISYMDLAPYYDEAESILNIAGESGVDPTEPKRAKGFPQAPGKLADISKKIKSAAQSLDLKPFALPLAINHHDTSRNTCEQCTTCDTFACAVEAKNDLPTMLIKDLLDQGLVLFTSTVGTKLHHESGRISSLQCFDRKTEKQFSLRAKKYILSAGALASPHLLLSSKLESVNPGGKVIGRYLMRHVNSIIFGIFPGTADKQKRHHKEIAILDYYFGAEDIDYPQHKLGSLQQVPTPPAGLVQNEVPGRFGKLISGGVKFLTGLLAIAEDQPQFDNYITVDHDRLGVYDMATPVVSHEYSKRDTAAVAALAKKAKKIMYKSGAVLHYIHNIRTFSHAVGTVRMGINPKTSALDRDCLFRGIENLYVVDGSFMPTSAAVNPSLTISANALRVAETIVDQMKSDVV